MRAKNMNALYILIICISLFNNAKGQKTVSILLNSERIDAKVQNGQVVSLDKNVPIGILEAIQQNVSMDAAYYKEINEILAGKYGTYYADLVKKELLAVKSGKVKPKKENLSRTATIDIPDLSVSFLKNTARLLGQSSEDLVKLTDRLRTLNINYIMLEGHKPTNNIKDYILTTNRVNTCKDYLIFKGIDPKKIKTKILLDTSSKKISSTVKITVK